MANRARIGYLNYLDLGTVSASSADSGLPASNTLDARLNFVWRSTSNSAQLFFDMGTSYSIGGVALLNANLRSGTSSWRVRLSTSDPSGVTGLTVDSGSMTTGFDTNYRKLIYFFTSAASGRYLRIDLSDSSQSYVEVGRAFAGIVWRPDKSYDFSSSIAWTDRSRRLETESGDIQIDVDKISRQARMILRGVKAAERTTHLFEIGRIVGSSADILLCFDDSSSNLGRDSYWGLPDEPIMVDGVTHNVFSTALTITERVI